jgi:hypothetical protein
MAHWQAVLGALAGACSGTPVDLVHVHSTHDGTVPIGGQAIGEHRGFAGVDHPAHERAELVLGRVRHDGQAHRPGRVLALLDRQGYSKTAIGMVWALGVLAEIALFRWQHRLFVRLDALVLLGLSMAVAALRFAIIGLTDGQWTWVLASQLMHAITFGVHHSAAMALRLEGALGTSAEMWLGMQANHDLWVARKRPPKVRRLPLAKLAAA